MVYKNVVCIILCVVKRVLLYFVFCAMLYFVRCYILFNVMSSEMFCFVLCCSILNLRATVDSAV